MYKKLGEFRHEIELGNEEYAEETIEVCEDEGGVFFLRRILTDDRFEFEEADYDYAIKAMLAICENYAATMRKYGGALICMGLSEIAVKPDKSPCDETEVA